MKSITKKIISTLVICGALVLEAGATAIGSLGKALNNIAKADAANAAPVNTVLWGEDFSGFSSGNVPSASNTNTVVYGGGSLTYSCGNGGGTTKVYVENTAGGTSPELLVAKSNGWFKAAGIPTGDAKEISLTFVSNKTTFSLACSSSLYTVSGSQKSWTLTLKTGETAPSTFDLTLTQTGSSNSRVDNIELKVTKAGGETPTSTYSVNYLANTTDTVTGLPSAETGLSAGSHTLSTAKPTRSGYDFVGWNTDSSATTGITSVTIGSSDVDVYAIWKEQGGGGGDTTGFALVTDANKLVAGTQFLLTLSSDETKAVAAWPASKTYFGYASSTVSGGIATTSEGLIFTLGGVSGSWTIKDSDYYYGLQNSTTALRSATLPDPATNYTWTISISDGIATMKTGGSGSRYLSWNASTKDRFSAYSSSCTPVKMYAKFPETKKVESITIKTPPSKITYFEGETFDPTGLVITATYDDKSTADIAYVDSPSDFSFSPSGSLATTDTKVTITYKEKTVDQAITVNSDTLNSITLGGSVTGSVSGGWDLSGVTVTGNYASGSRTITDATPTTSTPAPTEFKNYTVSVSVTYKTVTESKDYSVKVEKTGLTPQEAFTAEEAIAKETSGDVAVYVKDVVTKVDQCSASYKNATFWFGDLELYRVKLDSSLGEMADDTIQVGQTVLVYGKIVKFNSTIEIGTDGLIKEISNKEVSSIAVTTNPTNPQHSGKAFNPAGMVVTATYNDTTTDDVTDSVVIEPSTLASDTTSVTIKYTEGGITVQTSLSVDVLALSKITVEDQTTEFRADDIFAFDGKVYPWYTHSSGAAESKGSELDSTEYTVSKAGEKLEKGDNQTVTVTHTAGTKTYNCDYTIDVDYAYVTDISIESPIELGLKGEATFNATVSPETADQSVTYSIDEVNTTLNDGEYTLIDNTLTIAEDIAASGVVHVIATTVGKDSGGQSKSTTCVVSVSKTVVAQITAVNVSGSVSYKEQYVGKDFKYDGLTFTPVWSEGEHGEVTITGANIDWPELTEGMTSITGKYDTGTAKLDVDVEGFTVVKDYLTSIEISGDMTNKAYYSNAETWNFAGLSVSGKNASGDDATITESSVTYTANLTPAEYLSTSATKLVVTATYGQKTDTIEITGIVVNEFKLDSIEITSGPEKTNYIIGEEFKSKGLVVKANYSDGSSDLNFTSYSIDSKNVDMYKAGTYTINLTADGVEDVSFNVTYSVVTPQEGYDYWEKVTSAPDDWSGDYLLVYEHLNEDSSTSAYVWTGVDVANCYASATISDNKISKIPEGAVTISLAEYSEGYSVKVNGGTNNGKYTYGTANSNTINFGENPVENSVSYNSSSNCITISANTYLTFNAASNQMRFRYMKTDSNNVQLYKHVEQKAVVAELIKLEAALKDTTKKYYVGDEFSLSELSISGLYNDGNTKAVTSGVTFEGNKDKVTLTKDTKALTLNCGTLSCTVSINVLEVPTLTVTKTGENFSLSSEAAPVFRTEYSVTINPSDHYEMTSVEVKVGETVIKDAYNSKTHVVTIPAASVVDNVTITGVASLITHSVTNLNEDLIVSTTSSVADGGTYEATVSTAAGYGIKSITVTMGNKEVDGAYDASQGKITIVNVDADIKINSVVEEEYAVATTYSDKISDVNTPKSVFKGDDLVITFKVAQCYDYSATLNGVAISAGQFVEKDGVVTLTIGKSEISGNVAINISTAIHTYAVSINSDSNISIDKEEVEGLTSGFNVSLTADKHYKLPDSITVTMGGSETSSYEYDKSTGKLVFTTPIVGDVVITAVAESEDCTFNTTELVNLTTNAETQKYGTTNYEFKISSIDDKVYDLPDTIKIVSDGGTIKFTYDSSTGIVVIDEINGNISIAGEGVVIKYKASLTNDSEFVSIENTDVAANKDFVTTLTADEHCSLPEEILVVAESTLSAGVEYTYNKNTGVLTVFKEYCKADISIKVVVVHDDVSITGQGLDCTVTFDGISSGDTVEYGTEVSGSVKPAPNYIYPTEIKITSYGVELTPGEDETADYKYDYDDGTFVIYHANGDIVVSAKGSLGHAEFKFVNEDGKATIDKQDGDIDVFEPLSCKVSVESGYVIDSVTVTMGKNKIFNVFDPKDNSIYIQSVNGNVVVTVVTRAVNKYDVTINEGYDSFVTVEGLVSTITEGENAKIVITAKDGYNVVVKVNNVEIPNIGGVYTVSIVKASENVAIEVSATAKPYDVSYDLEHVTIGSEITSVTYGGTYQNTIKADNGYVLGSVKVFMAGVEVTGAYESGTISINNVTGAIIIKAKAVPTQVNVTYVLNGVATVSNMPSKVDYDGSLVTTVTALPGYKDLVITVNGQASGAEINLTGITADVEIVVTASKVTCSVSFEGEHASLDNVESVTFDDAYVGFVTFDKEYRAKEIKVLMSSAPGSTEWVEVSGAYSNGRISINRVTGDIKVVVTIESETFTVTTNLSNATSNGVDGEYGYNDTFTATFASVDAAKFDVPVITVKVNGIAHPEFVNGNIVTITGVSGVVVIDATSKPIIKIEIENASIPGLPETINYGDEVQANVEPEVGYEIAEVKVYENGTYKPEYARFVPDEVIRSSNRGPGHWEIYIPEVTGKIEIVVTASKVTCSVSFEGEHASLDNVESVTFDDAYVGIVTFEEGYRAKEVKVLMSSAPGSTEWVEVSGAYSNGRISINHVTGDIKVVVTIESETFTVTTNLSNATSTGVDGEYGYNDTFTATFASVDAAKFDVPVITVKVNGIAHPEFVNGNIVTITGVSGVVVIDATSKPIIKIEIENASIPGLPETINYGDEVQANVEPEVGYEIAEVKVYENGIYKPEYAIFVPDEVTRSSNRGPGHWEIHIPEVTGKIEIVVDSTPLVYGVDVTGLQNVSLAGEENATHDATYVAKLNPDAGYQDVENIKVFMNGVDVTEDVVVDDYIFIAKVTGAIRISASASEINYTISYDLSHVTSSNKAEDVVAGASYMTTLTVDKDYCNLTVTVLVNGVDVTEDVYDNGTIVFVAVLGDVDIKASAVALELTEVTVTPGTLEVAYDGSISDADFVATAHYNDGTSEVVEIAEISGFNGKIVGTQDVTIVAAGKEVTVKVTVKASEVVESITATTEKTEVNLGESFTKDDVKVTYVYTDGHTLANQAAESISGFNASQVGAQVITVTAAGKTTTITVTVKGTVVSSIAASGYTDTIDQGKDYVFDGKVTATYADGSTAEVTGFRVSSVDTSEAGDKVVKITFENVSVDITIHVVQSKTPLSPTASAGIIGGAVVGISAIAVGLYFLLKKFKI